MTISYIVHEITPVLLVGMVLYGFTMIAVNRTNRQAKRETNAALSPLLTCVSETLAGSSVIHAMNFERFFQHRMIANVNAYNRYNHFHCTTQQWSMLVTNLLSFVVSVSTAVLVYWKRETFPDLTYVGVALNYSFVLPYFLSMFSMVVMFLATGATSLERVLDFITGDVPQEPPWTLPTDAARTNARTTQEHGNTNNADTWPREGKLVVQHASMRYRPGLPLALKDVSFEIAGGDGNGDNLGKLFLDSVDLCTLGVHTARRAFAIIPQQPLMIAGSVGHNLDPFGIQPMERMVDVLETVGLQHKKNVTNDDDRHQRMNMVEVEAGSLSAGEQQLLALARLLLQSGTPTIDSNGATGNSNQSYHNHTPPEIVIMDEPTANIDSQTDDRIQTIIQNVFGSNVTVIDFFVLSI